MSEKREYRSEVRDDQARRTRRRVVEAAAQLFVERGYAGTTIDAIAERASVSRRTVFTSVGSKVELLKTAWDWAITGDDLPIRMRERPTVAAMRAERDPDTLVDQWVTHVLTVGSRVAPLALVLASAADVDEDAASLHRQIDDERHTGAANFVSRLEVIGGLRHDLTVAEGADMAWVLMDPLLALRLRRQRGWSEHQIREWLLRLTQTSLRPTR
jgi:AcrR family transcriptional regulator